MQSKTLIELEREAKAGQLATMRKDLTTGEIKRGAGKLKVSTRSLYRYFSGNVKEVRSVDTANDIIAYFSGVIKKKQKQLATA
jgi:hypothetical protein